MFIYLIEDYPVMSLIAGVVIASVAGTAAGTIYSEQIKDTVYSWANYGMDVYLNYKWSGYDPQAQIESVETAMPYLLNGIEYITGSNKVIRIGLKKLFDKDIINLRDESVKIVYEDVVQEILANDPDISDKMDKIVIYVHYIYGQDKYILPIEIDAQKSPVDFPVYSADDMDSCFKSQYTSVSVGGRHSDNDDQLMELVCYYAGPKGNFYSDLDHLLIDPRWIRCNRTNNLILSSENDTLKLTNLMCEQYEFKPSNKIKIEGSMF
jgi:hypothetical protein